MIEVNKDNFETEVLKQDKVLVDFNADWCGPCKMLKPILEEISESIKICSVNIDKEDLLTAEYQVSSIPCLVLFNEGKEVKRSIGFKTKDEILEMVGDV